MLLFSLFAGGFLLETGCRFLFDHTPDRFTLFKPHPKYLYTLRPGFQQEIGVTLDTGVSGKMPVAISDQGLRDRHYDAKAPDEYRVLMIGDSFLFGWGLPESESLPRRFEAALRAAHPGRNISVINAGVCGYAPWQELGLLEETGLALQPDLVLLQTFMANDLADTLAQTGPVRALQVNLQERLRILRRLSLEACWQGRMDSFVLAHSHLYFHLWRAYGADLLFVRLFNRLPLIQPVTIPPIPPTKPGMASLEPDLSEWYPELEEGWELFQRDVKNIAALCAERKIPLTAFNIPYPMDMKAVAAYLSGEHASKHTPDKANRMVEELFKNSGISFTPLLEAFRTHPAPETLYFTGNEHLKPAGNALVVERLLEGTKPFFQ